jgi:hypothetical protein
MKKTKLSFTVGGGAPGNGRALEIPRRRGKTEAASGRVGIPRMAEEPYPLYVKTDDERRRWDLCRGISAELWGDDVQMIWQATRTLYMSPVPTDGISADGRGTEVQGDGT